MRFADDHMPAFNSFYRSINQMLKKPIIVRTASAQMQQPDISAGGRRRILMRNIILVAVAALGLSAAIAPMASAASADQQGGFAQGGPYARISNGPGNLVTRAN